MPQAAAEAVAAYAVFAGAAARRASQLAFASASAQFCVCFEALDAEFLLQAAFLVAFFAFIA